MKTLFKLKPNLMRSKGSRLFDEVSDSYFIDLFSMYSSLPLGYNHEAFDGDFETEALVLAKHRLCSNAFEFEIVNRLKQALAEVTFAKEYHFCCTGALAIESAIKLAIDNKIVENPRVISITNSFHGVNSWGFTTSRVGVTEKRLLNYPQLEWPNLTIENAIEYLKSQDLRNVVAVVVEPIQCTSGDIYLSPDSIRELRNLCRQNKVCFILDEIQTGFATTGRYWYYEHLGIEPDLLVFGKKSQVCGVAMSIEYENIYRESYQKLQVTFDGDLLDMLRCIYLINHIKSHRVLERVSDNQKLFHRLLSPMVENYRGIGHLIAFDFETTSKRDRFVCQCLSEGLLVNRAGEFTIRLRPNLAIGEETIETVIKIMKGQLCD